MSVTRLPPGPAPRLLNQRAPRGRRPLSQAGISRRRWMVNASKYLLPVLAAGLLGAMALWPEFARLRDQRLAGGKLADVAQGQIADARYRGIDAKGEPYTITAVSGRQVNADRLDLNTLKADVTLQSGTWMMVQSDHGVYTQRQGVLDLYGHVVIYRDDGTTLHTPAATVDLTQGAAASGERVHAEGPFGTLDAQGFTLTDKGHVVQFTGPARLLLNGAGS
jgi:lipopolysaccharide export system protein LptC